MYLPSAQKTKLPSHQDFGEFAIEVKKVLQATPPEYGRETGVCATTIYVQQHAAAVLYDTSTRCTYSSLEPLVPGAAYLVYQAGSTWYIRPGRHAHEPGTSSASCCCNGSVG